MSDETIHALRAQLEDALDKIHDQDVALDLARQLKERAERERDEARGALEEIQSATRESGYGPAWTAFKIASHALGALARDEGDGT